MTPASLRIVLAVLGAAVALGNAYLQGGLQGALLALPTVLGSGVLGGMLIKRPGDVTAHQANKAIEAAVADAKEGPS